MSQSLKNLTIGLSGVAIATLCTTAFAPSASAFTFSNNNTTIGVDTTDINKTFTVKFDGNVATQGVSDLSSEAVFKFLGFTSTSSSTTAQFEVLLKNTSGATLDSRASALGFNTDKAETSATASGVFTKGITDRASLPNGFGSIDVCYTTGSTCQGGRNGGVNNDQSLPGTFQQGSFLASVTMSGAVSSFSLSNMGVRYQSISGTSGGKTFNGDSGTGRGTFFVPPVTPPPPRRVPEPTAIGGLVVMGLAAMRLKKKHQTEACEA
jgi:hypothetical protein